MCDCVEASRKGQRSQITAFYISNRIHTLAFQKVQWNPESQIRGKKKEKEAKSTPVFLGERLRKRSGLCFWGASQKEKQPVFLGERLGRFFFLKPLRLQRRRGQPEHSVPFLKGPGR